MKKLTLISLMLGVMLLATVSANTIASSTMYFQGNLDPVGDGYGGTIAMVDDSSFSGTDPGFDVYAENGAWATYELSNGSYTEGTVTDYDAYTTAGGWGSFYDPDCADWYNYQLRIDGNHWYLEYNGNVGHDGLLTGASATPMSGTIDWDEMYAYEEDTGVYYSGMGTPEDPNYAATFASLKKQSTANAWDMDWSWGSDYVPLEYPGFKVIICENCETYKVKLKPAEEPEDPCEVIVDFPSEGVYLDPVIIEWHYEGDCDPYEYNLRYQEGTCDREIWEEIVSSLTPSGTNNNVYEWDVTSMPSGEYCIAANMDQLNGPDVGGVSGVWYLDLTPPYVNLSVGTPQEGDCSESSGDCYVTTDTEITLTCSDDNPDEIWQSDPDYIEYSINGGTHVKVSGDTATFKFTEDSEHDVEYWCYDKVGKESLPKTKDFFVNSEGPTIEKTVSDPKVDASTIYPGFDWFVNGDTQICLSAVKGNSEHPTPGDVTIICDYAWWIGSEGSPWSGEVNDVLDGQGCFSYAENSFHVLSCTATDALGNTGTLTEKDIVNLEAPTTTLSYNGPQYGCFTKWIDTVSNISLTAVQGNPGHPTPGDITTYYREQQVDDDWCYHTHEGSWTYTSKEEQGWIIYENPFELLESCRAVEYYSVDALGNSENVHVEFVFSDHTAPELDLSVGESGKNCDNLFVSCEPEWDWKVTIDTPITLSCSDSEPHPSGVNEICYTIYWDGATEEPTTYCVDGESVTFTFSESCEHIVEYNCTDNVGKYSEDSRTFKVIGEDFPINLDKKWNLISVPVNLLSSNVQDVFDDSAIEEVWSYEDEEWLYYIPGDEDSTLTDIVPGRGYWVKTSDATDLIVGGSLFEEAQVGNSVPINSGWNLIGHYGMALKPRNCALASIFNEWSTLVGYDSSYSNPFYDAFWMNAGEGYWLFAQGDDSYAYSNSCSGYPIGPY